MLLKSFIPKTFLGKCVALVIGFVVFFVGLIAFCYMDDDGFFEDYTDWKLVEIPTESELKATVKIPKDWNFVVEGGRVYIKDIYGNVIATELYEGYRMLDKDINKNLPQELQILENYKLKDSGEHPCYLHKIDTVTGERYALEMDIMSRTSTAPETGCYKLKIVFEEGVNIVDLYPKIKKSYRYGGLIKDE